MSLSIEQQRQKVRDLKKKPILNRKVVKVKPINVHVLAQKELAEKRVIELYQNPTKTEFRLIKIFEHHNIPFEFQKLFIKGMRFYIVDFFIYGLIIEIDGRSHSNTKDYDAKRTKWLLTKGSVKKVVRFKNKEVYSSPLRVLGKILIELSYLKNRKI